MLFVTTLDGAAMKKAPEGAFDAGVLAEAVKVEQMYVIVHAPVNSQ